MANIKSNHLISCQSVESAAMVHNLGRAGELTAALNQLTFNDMPEIRCQFAYLIDQPLGDDFVLIPPFYTTDGQNIRIGHKVFINQNCTMYDLGGIEIGDEVMIGPNVSIMTASHPLSPAQRRNGIIAKSVVIKNNVWIACGVIIIGGVTIGENSVIAAGAVVTADVPANTMVGGNPARIIRYLTDE